MNRIVHATVAAAVMVSAMPAGAQISISSAAALSAPPAAVAQAIAPAALAADSPAETRVLLKSGTPIRLKMASSLSSKTAKVGDSVTMTVARDVVVHGQVVIPANAVATGEVTAVQKRAVLCRSGVIDSKLTSIEINGQRVPLTMAVRVQGKGSIGAVGAIMGILAYGPLAAVVTGKSAVMAPGRKAKGKIVGDVALAALKRPTQTASR